MEQQEYERQFEDLVYKINYARQQYDLASAIAKSSLLEEVTNLKDQLLALTRRRKACATEPLYKAKFPANEQDRVKTLRDLKILDSPFEALFDDFVKLAGHICGTPISVITLIDAERQWFKASMGFPGVTETHRDPSICAHTILANEILEVPDTTQDVRFADNPFVLGQPEIRFYAGVPITMPLGENIGTLCVIDRKVNSLTADQKTSLSFLAKMIARTLVIRHISLSRSPNLGA